MISCYSSSGFSGGEFSFSFSNFYSSENTCFRLFMNMSLKFLIECSSPSDIHSSVQDLISLPCFMIFFNLSVLAARAFLQTWFEVVPVPFLNLMFSFSIALRSPLISSIDFCFFWRSSSFNSSYLEVFSRSACSYLTLISFPSFSTLRASIFSWNSSTKWVSDASVISDSNPYSFRILSSFSHLSFNRSLSC